MPPRPPGITQPPWSTMFPAQVVAIVSAIVGGAPFARSLTPLPTNRASVSFPQLDPDDPAWVAELGEIPLLTPDTSEYEVAVSKLAGSILISVESIEDTDFPVTQQTEQILRDTFSHKLDRDFIGGTGPHPTPTGILAVADEVTGADWLAAVIKAKAEIATAGGEASHVAFSPDTIGDWRARAMRSGTSCTPTRPPSSAGWRPSAPCPRPSRSSTTPRGCGWRSAATSRLISAGRPRRRGTGTRQSLRIVGRFALAAPLPSRSVRKLKVEPARTAARAKA